MTMLSGYAHLVTLAQWEALPADSEHSYELVEGVIRVVPRPVLLHQRVTSRLAVQLDDQLPPHLTALAEVEVVVDGTEPATVRVPDVIVTSSELAAANPARVDASDVLLAVEVHSPGTRRTDRVLKLAEYAQAGIPSYWLVEIDDPVTITVLRLNGRHYAEVATSTGRLIVDEPARLEMDATTLTAR